MHATIIWYSRVGLKICPSKQFSCTSSDYWFGLNVEQNGYAKPEHFSEDLIVLKIMDGIQVLSRIEKNLAESWQTWVNLEKNVSAYLYKLLQWPQLNQALSQVLALMMGFEQNLRELAYSKTVKNSTFKASS